MSPARPATPAELTVTLTRLTGSAASWPLVVGPQAAGWPALRDLGGAPLRGLALRVADRIGTDSYRVGASVLQLGLAARLWWLTISGAAAGGCLLRLGDLRWHDVDGSVTLGLPEAEATVPEHLASEVARSVLKQHIEPLHAGLRELPESILWGNAAAALIGLGAATPAVDELLADARLRGRYSFDADRGWVRTSCCLFWQGAAGARCADCLLKRTPIPAVQRSRNG